MFRILDRASIWVVILFKLCFYLMVTQIICVEYCVEAQKNLNYNSKMNLIEQILKFENSIKTQMCVILKHFCCVGSNLGSKIIWISMAEFARKRIWQVWKTMHLPISLTRTVSKRKIVMPTKKKFLKIFLYTAANRLLPSRNMMIWITRSQ